MTNTQENTDCGGDPCLWCCFPCLISLLYCELCCKATCMFICCIKPDSVKPNNNISTEISSKEKETEKEYYANMFSTNIK